MRDSNSRRSRVFLYIWLVPLPASQFCTVRAVTFKAFANCSWLSPSRCRAFPSSKVDFSSPFGRAWARMFRAFKSGKGALNGSILFGAGQVEDTDSSLPQRGLYVAGNGLKPG